MSEQQDTGALQRRVEALETQIREVWGYARRYCDARSTYATSQYNAATRVLIGLGVWQVERLKWKEGLIAQAEAASALPPAPLAQVLASASPEFRRVILDCPGLATAKFVQLQTITEDGPGLRRGTRIRNNCALRRCR